MSSNSSKPASVWLDYRTMIRKNNEQAGRDVNLTLSMSRWYDESKSREDRMQQQLDPNLLDVDRNPQITYDGSAVKKFLKEMAILKANVYDDLVKAETNALKFLEMEDKVATLIPTSSSNTSEGNLTVRRINELLSGSVGCGCKKQAAHPCKPASKFQELQEFVHKTAGLGKISPQEQAMEKLDVYYHTLMPGEITKEENFGDNTELFYIEKRLREIKDTCRHILRSLDTGEIGTKHNSVFKDQQNTKGFSGVSFGRGRMTGLQRMDGTILAEPSKNTDGKAIWGKK